MDLSTYLDGLFQKTEIPPSELAHFLSEMRKTPSGPLITSKLLVAKIQSASETIVIRAFNFLEGALETEVEGSIEFRTEIGRYRFLNELIRILSPKYYGTQTNPTVKDRAVKFLTDAAGSKRKQWFPSEHSKIDAVYKSLVEGGIILPNAVDPDAEFQKSIFERGENAILLKKLLQSKDPTDLQAANRLIKNLVDEEAKRNERRSEIHSLIDRIETSTALLTEMCSQPQIDREIVDELASSCQTLRNRLGCIGTETNEEIVSLLQASENIEKALNYYDERKNHVCKDQISYDLIDPTPKHKVPEMPASMSLADELLIGMDLGPVGPETSIRKQNGAEIDSKFNEATNLLNFDIDLGVGFSPSIHPNHHKEDKKESINTLDELGILSKKLIQQSLSGKEITTTFASEIRSSDKVTLNQLQRQCAPEQKQYVQHTISNSNTPNLSSPIASTTPHITLLDLGYLEKISPVLISSPKSELPLPADENALVEIIEQKPSHFSNSSKEKTDICNKDKDVPMESLDSNFSLEEMHELDLDDVEFNEFNAPVTIPLNSISCGNELIELSFTFGTFPRIPSCVKVIVITVTNRNPVVAISDYGFQLLPPKGIQVKLFSPSLSELKPWKKRFLPPPVLTQAALVRVPSDNTKGIKLKFILSFYLGDETALYNSEVELPF